MLEDEGRLRRALRDSDVNRWHANLAERSELTADIYARRLDRFCEEFKTTPSALWKLDSKAAYNSLIDAVRHYRNKKLTGSTIKGYLKPVISWLRETAKKYDYRNVEFRLGEIEHMPIESNSVDLVISNCVLCLVPDKRAAFKEIYRVLKPGGKISISDMVATQEGRKIINPDEWAECVSGAITFKEYRDLLEETGFREIEALDETHPTNEEMREKGLQVKSMAWMAQKPS